MDYFGYSETEFMPCEICGARIADIHHLVPKSLSKAKVNLIDNLIGVCRDCHDNCHRNNNFNQEAMLIHRKKLLGVKTDHEIKRYL